MAKALLTNAYKRWYDDEEQLLLNELQKNIDIKQIAQNHKRTVGGIKARCNVIAYKLYLNKISIAEITKKTKLDENKIIKIIEKKSHNSIDLNEMKNDIKELKNTMKELVDLIRDT